METLAFNSNYSLKLLDLTKSQTEDVLHFTDKTTCLRLVATCKAFAWMKTESEMLRNNTANNIWCYYTIRDHPWEKRKSFYKFTNHSKLPYINYKGLSQYIYPHIRPIKVSSAMERLELSLSRYLFRFCDSRDYPKLILLNRDFSWLKDDSVMWKMWLLRRFPFISRGLDAYPQPYPKGLHYDLHKALATRDRFSIYDSPVKFEERRAARWTLQGHIDEVTTVAVGFFNQVVVSGSLDHTVRIWKPNQSSWNSTVLATHDAPVTTVASNPDGTTVAWGSSDGTVHLMERDGDNWSSTSLKFKKPIHLVDLEGYCTRWSPTSDEIARFGPGHSNDSLSIQTNDGTQYCYQKYDNAWIDRGRERVVDLEHHPTPCSFRGRLQVEMELGKNEFSVTAPKPYGFVKKVAIPLEIRQYGLHAGLSDLPTPVVVVCLPQFFTRAERALLRRVNWLFFRITLHTTQSTNTTGPDPD